MLKRVVHDAHPAATQKAEDLVGADSLGDFGHGRDLGTEDDHLGVFQGGRLIRIAPKALQVVRKRARGIESPGPERRWVRGAGACP